MKLQFMNRCQSNEQRTLGQGRAFGPLERTGQRKKGQQIAFEDFFSQVGIFHYKIAFSFSVHLEKRTRTHA